MLASGTIIARTPALPLDVVARLQQGRLDEALSEVRSEEWIDCSISILSENLYKAAQSPILSLSAKMSILAYLLRMSARTVPFGTSAAVSLVNVSDQMTLAVGDDQTFVMSVRPDMAWLASLVERVSLEPPHSNGVRLDISDLATLNGERYIVLNPRFLTGEPSGENGNPVTQRLAFSRVALAATSAVRHVEHLLASGPLDRAAVAASLAETFGETLESSNALIDELESVGFLINDAQIYPVGDKPWLRAVEYLANLGWDAGPLQRAIFDLEKLGESPVKTISAKRLQDAAATLRDIHPWAITPLQVDASRQLNGALSASVMGDVSILEELLLRGPRGRLRKLRAEFLERFGTSVVEVPILELFDAVRGFAVPGELEYDYDAEVSDRMLQARFDMALDALVTEKSQIDLSNDDIGSILPSQDPDGVPTATELGFEVIAQSLEEIGAGNYAVAPTGYYTSGTPGRALARFAWALGASGLQSLNELAGDDARGGPEVLRCELVMKPQNDRTLNVILRPRIIERSISLGYVRRNDGHDIQIKDVLVGLDGTRFFLRDQTSGAVLDVCQLHNLNTLAQLPGIGRFISLIARDGWAVFGPFNWGRAAEFPALPRLTVGRVILSLASWRLRSSELRAWLEGRGHSLWTKRLPRWVQIGEYDSKIPVDLESATGREMLLHEMRGKDGFVRVEECLTTPSASWLRDKSDRAFRCEFISSRSFEASRVQGRPAGVPFQVDERSFPVGSEWLYAKVYCAREDVEHILDRYVRPLIDELKRKSALRSWFFVRYADTRYHVRLRLHLIGEPAEASALALPFLNQGIINRDVRSIGFDVYEREIERYGGVAGMELCEDFFHINSQVALNAFCTGPKRGPDESLLECVYQACRFLDCFSFTPLELAEIVTQTHIRLSSEERALVARVRSMRSAEPGPIELNPYSVTVSKLTSAVSGVRRILSDLLHMHCNRFGVEPASEVRVRSLIRKVYLEQAYLQRATPGST